MSAQIVTRLQLTRGVAQEALVLLRDERKVQCNLLEILRAVRYKTLTKEGLSDTRCPLIACRGRDSFPHMLKCYDLESSLETGAASAQFLVRMAKKTQILDENAPRQYEE